MKGLILYIHGKGVLMFFNRHMNGKYKYGSREFRRRGYDADAAGKNGKLTNDCLRSQLKKGYTSDRISVKGIHRPDYRQQKKAKRGSRLERLPEIIMRR